VHLLSIHLYQWVSCALDLDHLGVSDVLLKLFFGVGIRVNFFFILFDGQLPHPLDNEIVGLTYVRGLSYSIFHLFKGFDLFEC